MLNIFRHTFHILLIINFYLQTLSQKETSSEEHRQLFIDFAIDYEGSELFKFFYDTQNEYFVDLGAYDPIFASNTLNLRTLGWSGLNIEASPDRLPPFNILRKDETNLNYAISNESKYITLYELTEDSSSTTSFKVKEYLKFEKPLVREISVPSITLADLCQKHYKKRPLFINIDIEGYGTQALISNNWTNPLCVPDIILSELNQETVQSGLPLPSKILAPLNYTRFVSIGLNELYIHSSVLEKYKHRYEIGSKLKENMEVKTFYQLSTHVSQILNVTTVVVPHYKPIQDQVYYHFCKSTSNLNIQLVIQEGLKLSNGKNRPIVVVGFDVSKCNIVIANTFESKVVQNRGFRYLRVKAINPDFSYFLVYILLHSSTAHLPFFIQTQTQILEYFYNKDIRTPKSVSFSKTISESVPVGLALQLKNVYESLFRINRKLSEKRKEIQKDLIFKIFVIQKLDDQLEEIEKLWALLFEDNTSFTFQILNKVWNFTGVLVILVLFDAVLLAYILVKRARKQDLPEQEEEEPLQLPENVGNSK